MLWMTTTAVFSFPPEDSKSGNHTATQHSYFANRISSILMEKEPVVVSWLLSFVSWPGKASFVPPNTHTHTFFFFFAFCREAVAGGGAEILSQAHLIFITITPSLKERLSLRGSASRASRTSRPDVSSATQKRPEPLFCLRKRVHSQPGTPFSFKPS